VERKSKDSKKKGTHPKKRREKDYAEEEEMRLAKRIGLKLKVEAE